LYLVQIGEKIQIKNVPHIGYNILTVLCAILCVITAIGVYLIRASEQRNEDKDITIIQEDPVGLHSELQEQEIDIVHEGEEYSSNN
jgi:hypothetical protein